MSRFCKGDITVLTANWDLTIEYFVKQEFITYLHGNVRNPETLYLPTESIEEVYRPIAESKYLGDVAGKSMLLLEITNRLIIYGLSLSPLDPELGIFLSEGFHETENPKEIIIIDINPKIVSQRIRFFIPHAQIYCYTPQEL